MKQKTKMKLNKGFNCLNAQIASYPKQHHNDKNNDKKTPNNKLFASFFFVSLFVSMYN